MYNGVGVIPSGTTIMSLPSFTMLLLLLLLAMQNVTPTTIGAKLHKANMEKSIWKGNRNIAVGIDVETVT